MGITTNNDYGRAFEYACMINLHSCISKIRTCRLIENQALNKAKDSWDTLSSSEQDLFGKSARAAVFQIFGMEPRITENDNDILELLIQSDKKGEEGDVRDILIIRNNIHWEIGLSLKHNNFAVKHSRLGATLDFGKSWFGIPCSKGYWEDIEPVFSYLKKEKLSRKKFSDLPNKEDDVYLPLLNAFIKEISLQSSLHPEVPARLVEYLLGKHDFYKVISLDTDRLTRIQCFNMHGTLNKPASQTKSEIKVPVVSLPSRIVHIEFAPKKKTTVLMYLDGGWQFSFRIHNASTNVETSLKFDIQIVGMPTAIISINCLWKTT